MSKEMECISDRILYENGFTKKEIESMTDDDKLSNLKLLDYVEEQDHNNYKILES